MIVVTAEEDLEAANLWPIKEYIWRRQATIGGYIYNHLIYDLYTGADWMQVSSRLLQWWDKDLTQEEEGHGASKGEER